MPRRGDEHPRDDQYYQSQGCWRTTRRDLHGTSTNRKAKAAGGTRAPVEVGLPEFLALTTVGGFMGQGGNRACGGTAAVDAGEPILRPDKPSSSSGAGWSAILGGADAGFEA
jgi:hypothetical protein